VIGRGLFICCARKELVVVFAGTIGHAAHERSSFSIGRRIDETALQCDENGLCSIGRSGFGEDARHVDADGFLDDAEVIANLFIAPAEHDR